MIDIAFFNKRGRELIKIYRLQNGKIQRVRARKEVIVSGGAVNSPQLLLLSGIGPKKHLESLGIPVVKDLPGVGENLHNHVSFGLNFTLPEIVEPDLSQRNLDIYNANQTGPLSSTGLSQMTGILSSKYTTPDDPDIQVFFSGYRADCHEIEAAGTGRNLEIIAVNLHAKSRGS